MTLLSMGPSELAVLTVLPNRTEYETPSFRVGAGTSFITLESLDGAESPEPDPRQLSLAAFSLKLVVMEAPMRS